MKSFVILAALLGIAGLLAFQTTNAQPPAGPAAAGAAAQPAADAPKAKYTLEEVMQQAHGTPQMPGIRPKVLDGSATDDEKKKLLDLYISLTENAPPQGDAAKWKDMTNAVVVAMGKVVVGREDAVAEFETATDCNACHMEYRPARGRRGGGRRGGGARRGN